MEVSLKAPELVDEHFVDWLATAHLKNPMRHAELVSASLSQPVIDPETSSG
jgi:hypothetical protein